MNAAAKAAALEELRNKAENILTFKLSVPAVGYATATCGNSTQISQKAELVDPQPPPSSTSGPLTVENQMYSLTFDQDTGKLTSITNKASGASTTLSIDWGWYNSSVGGCTDLSGVDKSLREPACSGQKSGAYIFRPNSSTVFYPGPPKKPTISVTKGGVVTEVYQKFSDWATHVIRLYDNSPYVEVEWTAGPIPVDTPWMPAVAHDKNGNPMPNNWGKEVIVKYSSGLASKETFYTDSNGKEMVKRVYNKRGPTYPNPYKISEPVAGNYYPVNALMSLDDGTNELAVLTDVSMGGASLADGELEFMVHRRIQDDDSRGVQEPLNETMCGCNDIGAAPGNMGAHGHEGDGGCECAGLTMRGVHWLVFDKIDAAHETRRKLAEAINFPATVSIAPGASKVSGISTALGEDLPENIKLVTLTNNYAGHNDGKLLLRLSHLYEAGEHPTLAQPVTVDLSKVFSKAGLKITGATETTLTGNRPLSSLARFEWRTFATATDLDAPEAFEERVPFDYPVVTIRPMEVRTFMASFE
jgi:alpha-mannosidase